MKIILASQGILLGSSARANDFSAVVSASSNYFYRGYSKSGNGPSVRGNVEYQAAAWLYLGTWISRVDFDGRGYRDESKVEFYPYLGVNFNLADNWRMEASMARYIYEGRLFGKGSDYNEYSAALHFRDLLSFRTDFAQNLYNRGGNGWNFEISGRYPILEKLSVSAGVGYNDATPVLEYNTLYWNVGLTWFLRYAALDFRYVDLSETSRSRKYGAMSLPDPDNKFVFSLSIGF